jgi:ABC-2 type transport system ATP-binding protein
MTEPAIEVDRLTRVFGSTTAVRDLEFSVQRGELFGLVGPDGAGKTTTLRMLAGVLRPTSGDARVLGTSVASAPERVKHDIAYMSQRFGLYTDLTVMENLEFYADLYEVPRSERASRLERLFEFSNLAPFRDRLAGQLSGGMKQKLGLSCALIHQPKILLLDEPTFGVDPISRRDLWLIIHEMVAEGVTVVTSTAYMDEAERFDRLTFLHEGALLSVGEPDELRGVVEGEILGVRVDRPRDAQQLLRSEQRVIRAALFGDVIHVTVASAQKDRAYIERTIRDAGMEVYRVDALEPSLEDVFIEVIDRAERQ